MELVCLAPDTHNLAAKRFIALLFAEYSVLQLTRGIVRVTFIPGHSEARIAFGGDTRRQYQRDNDQADFHFHLFTAAIRTLRGRLLG